MAHEKSIYIKGARVHNLRNIELDIPHEKLIVITGLSGSGKSTLAFDTIFAEGQRRYVESLSSYARQFLGKISKPDVDIITGIAPAIAIEQKVNTRNPRSTVGTSTEIYEKEETLTLFRATFLKIFETLGDPVAIVDASGTEQEVADPEQYVRDLFKNEKDPQFIVTKNGESLVVEARLVSEAKHRFTFTEI